MLCCRWDRSETTEKTPSRRLVHEIVAYVEVSARCAAFGTELNSFRFILIPSECHIRRGGGVLMMCCSLNRTELLGMHSKPSECHLRRGSVLTMRCSPERAKLIAMYFESIRMSFTLWKGPRGALAWAERACGDVFLIHHDALRAGKIWNHGDVFNVYETETCPVRVSPWCAATWTELTSWVCTLVQSKCNVRCGYVSILCCIPVRAEIACACVCNPLSMSIALWRCHRYVLLLAES